MTDTPLPELTVLVVDDEDDLRDVIRRILERRSIRPLTAPDPATALDICRNHDGTIDVLLTDLNLPGMPGGELARQAIELRSGLAVVFVSGTPGDHAIHQGLIGPGSTVLQKPFNAESLTAAVRGAAAAASAAAG
jgi:DNA-binding response OmpR family regulator